MSWATVLLAVFAISGVIAYVLPTVFWLLARQERRLLLLMPAVLLVSWWVAYFAGLGPAIGHNYLWSLGIAILSNVITLAYVMVESALTPGWRRHLLITIPIVLSVAWCAVMPAIPD
jgi:hypothetical protein